MAARIACRQTLLQREFERGGVLSGAELSLLIYRQGHRVFLVQKLRLLDRSFCARLLGTAGLTHSLVALDYSSYTRLLGTAWLNRLLVGDFSSLLTYQMYCGASLGDWLV
jgi:hypothetical protein